MARDKHHIVPIAHLAGFTDDGTAGGALWVYDYFTGKQYSSTPRKVCREKDFYSVHDEPGIDPNFIEGMMAKLESILAPEIRSMADAGRARDKKHVG